MTAIAGLLSQIPLLSGLNADQLAAVEQICNRRLFTDGQTVVEEGAEADAAYFLIDGRVDCLTHADDGSSVATPIPQGATLLELAMIIELDVSATCIARGSAKMICIPRAQFQEIMQQDAELMDAVIATLTARLRDTADTMREVGRVFEDVKLSA